MNLECADGWREGITCPLCSQFLHKNDKQWYCNNSHSFDIAKQGYTNLLAVQHKKSKSPGDNKKMVSARTRFLSKNYYLPISSSINKLLADRFEKTNTVFPRIVDAGCGEGYYTHRLYNELCKKKINCDITGIDISKHAVLSAAKKSKNIRWFVANSSQIPVSDNSLDCIISLFSPITAAEFSRCLKDNGVLIIASTGPNHLLELREILYDEVNNKALKPGDLLTPYFKISNGEEKFLKKSYTVTSSLDYRIDLEDSDTIKDLLSMTPHYWRVSPKRKELLDKIEKMTITVDIQLYMFINTHRATTLDVPHT